MITSGIATARVDPPVDEPAPQNEKPIIYTGGLLTKGSHPINRDGIKLVDLIDTLADEGAKNVGRFASIRRFDEEGAIVEVLTVEISHARKHPSANHTIRSGDQIALLKDFSDWKDLSDWSNGDRKTRYERVSIVGPITSGGSPEALKPPNDDEVLHAFESVAPDWVKKWTDEKNENRQIVKEKIADFTDPPRFYPLIGDAQLHHAHYKVTLKFGDNIKVAGVHESEVIYIDHNHFHMIRGEQQ